ncbi:hypothetical protein B0T14DRAFT_528610 [Immersiella caudata]|uniref:Heterokaryon incompatibility domain-containing protein n=1 Tax=Immersiella caudata TaxID=314043 RepID=A0AA39WFL8_9PEZI|nr:hypothetical protein B0T14DRAFT_528610 [Immersiella caudata]
MHRCRNKTRSRTRTWGASQRTAPIVVDDKTLLIIANLLEATEHLDKIQQRDQSFKPFRWIDMICINRCATHKK